MKTRLVGLSLIAGWLFSGAAWTAEPNSTQGPDSTQIKDEWRGQKVLVAKPGVLLRDEPNDEAPTSPISTTGIWLEIRRSEGDWLEVDWGWIRAADVVRKEQAVEHFTAELARSESAFAFIHRSRAWLKKSEFDKAQADASEALRLEPNNARAYFLQSRIAFNQKRAEEERAACDRALVIDPRDPFALEARSRLKAETGDVDGAIGDLDLAIESFPRSSRLRSVRGYYGELKGDYGQALVDFNEAIQLDPHAVYPLSRRATIHLRRKDLDKALHDAEEALRADAKMPRALAIRGAVRAQKGEWDAALADLDEAIRFGATDFVTFHNRGASRFYQGQFDEAVIDFTQAISLNPNAVDSYAARADAWAKKGDAASAITDLTQYLRLRPMDANAYSKRGAALLVTTDIDAAFKDFNAALEIDPRHVGALLGRGRAWQLKNEPAKAIDDVNAAFDLAPNNPDAYVVRGWLRRDADPDAALKDLDAAIAINPRRLDALMGRAEIWQNKADPEKAIANLTAAIEVDPKFAEAYLRRAQIYSWQGYHRQAIADCRAVLAKEPKNLRAYSQMAQVHSMAGDNEGALEDYAAALLIDPHDDQIRFDRAFELFNQDKFDLALADIEEVLRHGKRVADAYSWRGYFSMRRGNFDKAMADFNEAIRLEPGDAEHYRMRADCWFAMKQFDKAIAEAEEALRLSPKLQSAADVRRQSLEAKQQPVKANDHYSEATPYGAETSSDARFEGAYWLELRGPKGLKYTQDFAPSTVFGPRSSPFPVRLPMLGGFMPLKLVDIPGAADAALYAWLESKRLPPKENKLSGALNPSITLAQADLDAALAGKEVTKILVLHRKADEDADGPEFEVMSSSELDAKTDPAEVASARGPIVASLKLSNKPLEELDLQSVELKYGDYEDDTFSSVDEPVRLYEIELQGPEGVKVAYEAAGPEEFTADFRRLPIRLTMTSNTITRFKLAGIPSNPDVPLYVLLTPKTISSELLEMVIAAIPVVRLSEADLSAALAGKDVTKILVLRPGEGEPAQHAAFEFLSSTDLDPKIDPVAAASRRGTVVAGLLISNRVPALFSLALDDEQLALCLEGPEGLTLTYEGPSPSEFKESTHPLPAHFYQVPGSARRFKLGGPPTAAKDPVYMSLETAPTLPPDNPSLTERQLPITFSKPDLEAALAGKIVTCVVYLTKTASAGEPPVLQTLSSVDMELGDDLISETSKRGTIVAVLRLSQQLSHLLLDGFGTAEEGPPASVRSPRQKTGH